MPDIARFGVIDPIADLNHFESPYALADNNPVYFVDEYGLGVFNAIGNLWKRLKNVIHNAFVDCPGQKRRESESVAMAFRRPDFNSRTPRKINHPTTGPKKNTAVASEGKKPDVSMPNFDFNGIAQVNNPVKSNILNARPRSINNTKVQENKHVSLWYHSERYIPFRVGSTPMLHYKNNPSTQTTIDLDLRRSGIELGRILKTLASNPNIKLYVNQHYSYSKNSMMYKHLTKQV